jgi:hypothetical protein
MSPLVDHQSCYSVAGLKGHWHRDLTLPRGYQHFNWYRPGHNRGPVFLDDPEGLLAALPAPTRSGLVGSEPTVFLYTQHEIELLDGTLRHTRSSPNWEGGTVTYATCKHLMRCGPLGAHWRGHWLAGLCPKKETKNALLFAGVVQHQFDSNYDLGVWLATNRPLARQVKCADHNPRGDLYTPQPDLASSPLSWANRARFDHSNFLEPPGHTRSVEYYARSPGSVSDRPDGRVPKWWRDLEYVQWGRRPPCFVLAPVWLFSRPCLWPRRAPGRAVWHLPPADLAALLTTRPPAGTG